MPLSGRACTLRCISARCLPNMGLGGAVRRSHQDLALLVGTSYSRPRGRVRPCCCCALLVALLFFVVVIPQMGQLTFHASSSSARSIFYIFSMGQWTSRCPAAVSLFAFLGELYVNVNLGPAYPRLLATVRTTIIWGSEAQMRPKLRTALPGKQRGRPPQDTEVSIGPWKK